MTYYFVHSITAAILLLTAQINLAGSATWLSSPQNSAWENASNWTPGGPPNGPSDVATFAQSSRRNVNIAVPTEVNSVVFTSDSSSFTFYIPVPGCAASELIISGSGVTNNNTALQAFAVGGVCEGGRLIFNNAATAASAQMVIRNGDAEPGFDSGETIFNDTSNAAGALIFNDGSSEGTGGETIFNGASTANHASISNDGAQESHHGRGGQTVFNNTSTAANASIANWGSVGEVVDVVSSTIFNNTSTAGQATITSHEGGTAGSLTIFNDASTADSAILVANGGSDYYHSGGIIFDGTSTGGTARVKVFGNGYLDISGHQSSVTIGSLEGSGNVLLGGNNLRVGTNNIKTVFSGVISGNGSLAKVGSGTLTLQANHCLADSVGLILVSGSIIKLAFGGSPDTIASLVVNGVSQPPGVYGSLASGAPHPLPEFAGPGTVRVTGPVGSRLGNISTRAFVQTGDNVVIGGFIVQGNQPKSVIIRAIGPGLTQYGVPNPLYNPTLELHDSTGALIASNDNWTRTIIGGVITGNQVREIIESGYAPSDGRESAIIADLPPGSYTAIVRGVDNMTGVGLVEVYDLSNNASSILGNISTRAFVQTGDNVMIGGFIVQGPPKRVIIRAIGPELAAPPYNVRNALADPTLELHDHTAALIASNDNWQHTIIGGIITTDQVQEIMHSGHAPTQPSESAIIADLPPGNYTAIVRGMNNTAGVALVEVYDLD